MQIPSRLISACIVLTGLVLIAAGTAVWHFGLAGSASGMAAKLMCSGVFIANRDEQDVLTRDIQSTSIIMSLPRVSVDHQARTVSAQIPGLQTRYAVWRGNRGCNLLAAGELPEPSRRSNAITSRNKSNRPVAVANDSATRTTFAKEPWPYGDAPLDEDQWPPQINAKLLLQAADRAFAPPKSSSFSPTTSERSGQNTRALLVAHQGNLLVERYADGFNRDTPQLGLSMAKTVLSALIWKTFNERNVDFSTPVVDLMNRVPQAQWAADWRRDDRAQITLNNLIRMQDGLNHVRDQSVFSKALFMLFSEADTSHFAANVSLSKAPGEHWRYSSAVSNLLSRVLRDQFSSDIRYWDYPAKAIFEPIGVTSAQLETDDNGTFVASTYLWATPQDWLRIGQLLANDGRWSGKQILPAGWYAWASSANQAADGKPGPYGAHVWLTNAANDLGCNDPTALPTNGIVMAGHWGQMLAAFPDQDLVILRMGWSNDATFKPCELFREILTAVQN